MMSKKSFFIEHYSTPIMPDETKLNILDGNKVPKHLYNPFCKLRYAFLPCVSWDLCLATRVGDSQLLCDTFVVSSMLR